jgi:thiamine transport system substrate-binding protein
MLDHLPGGRPADDVRLPGQRDAALPEVFVEHAVLPSDPLELDPTVIGEHREAWIEAWTATVLR